ncbi:hypothetical protein C0995_009426 [Termitomyces sp. Mi166|nr:hypothetical protein C0995_009426 [Termitomyces sp. Mi166\
MSSNADYRGSKTRYVLPVYSKDRVIPIIFIQAIKRLDKQTPYKSQPVGGSQAKPHQVSNKCIQIEAQRSKEGVDMKDSSVIQPVPVTRPISAIKATPTIGHTTVSRPITSHNLSEPSIGPCIATKADAIGRKPSDATSENPHNVPAGEGKNNMKRAIAVPSNSNAEDVTNQSHVLHTLQQIRTEEHSSTVSTSVGIEKETAQNARSSMSETVQSRISTDDILSMLENITGSTDLRLQKRTHKSHSNLPTQKANAVEGSYESPSSRTGTYDNEYKSKMRSRSSYVRSTDADKLDEVSISRKKGAIRIPGSSMFNKLFKGNRNSVNVTSKIKISEDDIVIAVMGRVGKEGKRSFIDGVFGDNSVQHNTSSSHTHFFVAPDPGHPSRNIFLVYTSGGKEQKLNDAIRHVLGWLSDTCGDRRKFSGLIYLEDASTAPPTKLSRHALDLLDQCVERPNIVIATTGWDDDEDMGPLENRHKELIEQWRAFVDRGVNVLRLSAPTKTSRDVFHTSLDIVKLLLTKHDEKTKTDKRAVWKGKEQKFEDKFLVDPRDTDFVIPVMGPTGAGKSTFINYVAGQNITIVGHDLKSETQQLQHVILPHPTDRTRRIILVDTPGFDDTYVADSEILRRISVWLARSYSANMTLAGVIYLHEISQTRMLGTARKNLDMFNKLIGHDATKNVVLATTKWGDIPEAVGIRREEQLKDRHWKGMIDLGATLLSFRDSRESGWAIIQHIINSAATQSPTFAYVDSVAIQNELVEVRKMLPETEAGKTLLYTLEELLEMQRQSAVQLRKDESSDEVKAMMQENDQKIRATLKQIDDLSGNHLRAWLKRLKF